MDKLNSKLETRSLRLDNETHAKLEELTKNFENKNACLASLIQSYEIELNKKDMPHLRRDIETFQSFVTQIQSAYNSSLNANEQTEIRIRSEYEHLLKSKDETIIELQEKLKNVSQLETTASTKSKALSEELINCKQEIDNLRKQLDNVSIENNNNNNVIKTLTDITEEYKEYPIANKELQEQNNEFARKIDELESQNKLLNEKLASLVEKHNTDIEGLTARLNIDHEKALIELRASHQKELQEQQAGYSKKLNEYEDKTKILLFEKSDKDTSQGIKTTTTKKRAASKKKESITETKPD